MSEDDRTSLPLTDLSEESAAGTVQGAHGGADADAIDDYDKSGRGAVDTTLICTVSGIEKEAVKVQNAKEAAEVSSVVQEAAGVSSAVQRRKEWSIAAQQFQEVCRIVKEAEENLSIQFEESIAEFSRAVQESTAEYTGANQERAAERTKALRVRAKELLFSILEAASESLSPCGLDIVEVTRAVHQAAADALISLQRAAAEMMKIAQEEAESWHATQQGMEVEAPHAVEETAAEAPHAVEEAAAEAPHAVEEAAVAEAPHAVKEAAVEEASHAADEAAAQASQAR